MFQSLVDSFFEWEIDQILLVQKIFRPVEPYLEIISHVTTARFMHMYIFPFVLVFSLKYYVNVMIAATISHVSINVLKWILAGTRPYWWINETDLFTNATRPILRQTYLTCETSAGNPSGHVMMTASILFFIIRNIIYQTHWCRKRMSKTFRYFIWNIYVLIIGLVTLSRMYFACHFSHQCLLGSYFGMTISQMLQSKKINRFIVEMKRTMAFFCGFCVLGLVLGTYFGHHFLGNDPQWTIQKAFNYCKDPYFIKPETTPVYALVREFGFIYGLILCAPHANRFNIEMEAKWSIPLIITTIFAKKYSMSLIPRASGALIFYISHYFSNLMFIIILLKIVPFIAQKPKLKV